MRSYMETKEKIENVWFENERIYMRSNLANVYSRPLEAFPTLKDADAESRSRFTIERHGMALRWKDIDEDIHISSFYQSAEPGYDNEVAALFAKFPQLNVSEVARSIGIHKSLLSQYIYGVKTPSEKRMKEIKEALHTLGLNLIAATA